MDGVGDLGKAVGDGIAGIVGQVMGVLAAAYNTLAAGVGSILPGPWFIVAVIVFAVGISWLILRR